MWGASYTSRAALIFMQRVSLTHPVLASFLSGEFLLHIPCLLCSSVGSFSYTSHTGSILIWGVLLHIACWRHFHLGIFSYTSRAGFNFIMGLSLTHPMHAGFSFIGGFSLTHPVLFLFLCREFLLHIPCCLHFSAGSFSYTSHAGFFLCGTDQN